MPAFGLNDEVAAQFGLDDEEVGQSAVTKPAIPGGQAALAPKPQQMTYTAGGATPVDPGIPDVDTETGADYGTRVGMGFAPDEGQQLQYLAARLQQAYKQPVQVRIGPASKEPEFFSPKTQKWTTANRTSIPAMGVDAAIGLPATLGGAAALGVTANPVGIVAGGVAGASAGSALSQLAKNKIGKMIGAVDPDYPVGSDVGDAAAKGAAFEVGGQAMLGAARYARYWFKGARAFGAKEAAELGAAAGKADDMIREIEQRTGMPFNPTVGQKAEKYMGSTELGQKALAFDSALEKDGSTASKIRALHSANEDALASFFEVSGNDATSQAAYQIYGQSKQKVGEAISKNLTEGYNSLLAQARQMVEQLPAEVPAAEKGAIMQRVLAQANKEFKTTVEDPAWAKYRDGSGYNPKTETSNVRVPWTDSVRGLMSRWDTRNREAIMNAMQNDNSGLKLIFKKGEDQPASAILGKDGLPLKAGVKGEEIADVDLAQIDDTIKWIRSDARQALKNKQGVTYNEKDLVSLEKSLTEMRNSYLKDSKPELYDLLQQAESASKQKASMFRNSSIGDLLKKDGPDSFTLGPADALYRIISTRDSTAATEFAALTKAHPEAKEAAQQMIYALYRKAVVSTKTGAPNPKAHAEFMRDYGGVIRQFFTEGEQDTLNKLGGIGTIISKNSADLKNVLPQVKTLFGGELTSLNSGELARVATSGKFSKEKIQIALRLLNRNNQQELVSAWKSAVLDDLGSTVVKNGQINSTALATILNGPKKEVIETLLNSGNVVNGTNYIKDLKVLQEATDMIRAQGKGSMESQSKGMLVRLSRLLFGQFTPEARVVTFGQGSRTRAVPGEIYNAITDPKELSKLAQEARKTMDSVRGVASLSKIGEVIASGQYNY